MIKLTQLMNESEEKRPLSNEVKKHFMEIVSTYNKYQESMDRKSDIAEIAETLGGITEAARTLAIHEAGDWFDKHTVKRNMSELDKLGKQFDKVALEAKSLDQRMGGLYEDMGHILSRYYKIGEISEEQMKERLGMNEARLNVRDLPSDVLSDPGDFEDWYDEGMEVRGKKKLAPMSKSDERKLFNLVEMWIESRDDRRYGSGSQDDIDDIIKSIEKFLKQKGKVVKESVVKESKEDCGCGCNGTTPGGCNESLNEEPVSISMRNDDGSITTTIKEVTDLNEQETALYEFGQKVETLMEKNCPTDSSKWSYYKGQAKKKFDVYPSAYANGWAAKQYKGAGGSWKKC